jgi:hypothetical protein
MEQGLNDGGYLVCKFAFRVSLESFWFLRRVTLLQRVPGQSSLQIKDEEEADDDNGRDEDSASLTA